MATVLHICETAKGGPATYLNMIADTVGRQNNAIVVPESHAPYLDADLRQHRFAHTRRSLPALLRMIVAAVRANREEKPDLLFFHSTFALAALMVLKLIGVRRPMLYCAHGWAAYRYAEGSLKRRLVQRIEGLLCALPDRVVCCSKFDLAFARAQGYRGSFKVAENAVPERRADTRANLFDRNAPGGPRLHLLFVGRLDRQKGLDVLLEVAGRMATKRPELHFHVVGAAVLDDAAMPPLTSNVTLHGWVARSRIDDWYASADALVVPSRWEGLPLVIPEAYRNGTPVITSTNTGLAALVHEGKTGYTFDLSVDNLSDILELVTRDTLISMRPAARKLYRQRFTAQRLCATLRIVYRELLGNALGPVPGTSDREKMAEAA